MMSSELARVIVADREREMRNAVRHRQAARSPARTSMLSRVRSRLSFSRVRSRLNRSRKPETRECLGRCQEGAA